MKLTTSSGTASVVSILLAASLFAVQVDGFRPHVETDQDTGNRVLTSFGSPPTEEDTPPALRALGHDDYYSYYGYDDYYYYYAGKGGSKGSKGGSKGSKGGSKGSKSSKGGYYDDYYYGKGKGTGYDDYYGKGKGKGGGYDDDYYGKGKGKGGGYDDDYYGKGKGKGKGGGDGKGKGGGDGKGKGGGVGKGKGKGIYGDGVYSGDCHELILLAKPEEITAGTTTTEVGETLYFPVYDYKKQQPIGVYMDESTDIDHGDVWDCVYSGAVNFDWNKEFESWDSQINVAGTCSSTFNSITGGSGAYACADGYAYAWEDDKLPKGFVAFIMYICDGPCH